MKKNTSIIVLFVLLLLIIGGLVFVVMKPAGVKQSLVSTSTPPEVITFTVIPIKSEEASSTYSYKITTEYPQVAGLKDADVQLKINTDISKVVKDAVASFKKDQSENTETGVITSDGESTLDISFSKEEAVSGIVSFSLLEEYYSAGAAHPGSAVIALNYDAKTGKRIALSNLFSGSYLKVISTKSVELLTKQLGSDGDASTIKSGAAATSANYQVFFPLVGGLEVIFNEYQVASYAAGIQMVTIPYSDLKEVINTDGLLKNL